MTVFDYKDRIMERAEDIALERYGEGLYELPDDLAQEVYDTAKEDVDDSLADLGNYLADRDY